MDNDKVVYESVSQNEKNIDFPDVSIHKSPHGWGARHTQAILLFISFAVGYSIRAQLSISIVAMTSNSTMKMWYPDISSSCWSTSNFTECRSNNLRKENITSCCAIENYTKSWTVYRVYDWSESSTEMILFAFFVGYAGMMFPMGLLAQKYGGKITILIALCTNGVLSLITPWLPLFGKGGKWALCICRLLQGMTQAAFYPGIHNLLGKWAPANERARLSSYIYNGANLGTIIGFQIAGEFAGTPVLGWPATFWFLGVLSLLWCVMVAWLGEVTPYNHPNISTEEFAYITGTKRTNRKPKALTTPWKQIMTSPAVWGIVVTQAGSNLGWILIFIHVPLYMSKIHGIDIKNNGLLSSLPYISMLAASVCVANVTDWIASRKYLSIVNIRRCANSIGLVGCGLFLIGFVYSKSTTIAIILLVCSMVSYSCVHSGYYPNVLDIAPSFSGSVMGLSNFIGQLTSLILPVAVTNIVGEDMTNQYKWQILCLIVAGVQILSNAVFVVFARGTAQPWNSIGENQDTEPL